MASAPPLFEEGVKCVGVEPDGTEMAMKQELKEGNQDHLGKNMHQSCWRKKFRVLRRAIQ